MYQLNTFQQFSLGITTYIKALSLVFNKGLWIYFIYSFLIYLFLFFIAFHFIQLFTDAIKISILHFFLPENLPSWLSYISGILAWVLTIILKIIFFFIYSTFSKYIALIFMSPMMSILSERTETILTGNQFPFDTKLFIKNIARGISIALRNMFFQTLILLASCIIMLIPVLGWFSPIFILIISWYFYGFSMLDYTCERRNLDVSKSIDFMRKNKGVAIGNGFIFTMLFNIPFIGVMFASVLSPVAATIAVLELEKK